MYYPIYPYNTYKGKLKILYNLKRFYKLLKQLIFVRQNKKKFNDIKFKIKRVPFIHNIFVRDADIVVATAWATAYSVNNLRKCKGNKYYFVQGYKIWESSLEYVDKSYKLPMHLITTCSYLKEFIYEKFNVDSTLILNAIDFSCFIIVKRIWKDLK